VRVGGFHALRNTGIPVEPAAEVLVARRAELSEPGAGRGHPARAPGESLE